MVSFGGMGLCSGHHATIGGMTIMLHLVTCLMGAPLDYDEAVKEWDADGRAGLWWTNQVDQQKKTDELLNQLHHYEISVPHLVDHQGEFVSFDVTHSSEHLKRKRRSTSHVTHTDDDDDTTSWAQNSDPERWVFYKLTAFGHDFHFNLTLNSDLISPTYSVEYWNESGIDVTHGLLRDCHYVGHLGKGQQVQSRVALSNCYGLHGVFATADDEYFVEPLWNSTQTREASGHLHVVYRRSAVKQPDQASKCGLNDSEQATDSSASTWSDPRSPWSFNEVLKPHHHGYRHKDKQKQIRRHRRSISQERHVEMLVVVDKEMVAYYGKYDIEHYVLTVMNIVANLYRDPSIGNAINIMVTRLIVLTKDQPKLAIMHHADRTLHSFCRWQSAINAKAEQQGLPTHDNAVLITRYDICSFKNEPCGTLGLAPVGGMCEHDRSCSINEDIGLASAFTIAHEIGHNFGMQHDGSGNNCGKVGYEPAKIMASQLTKNTDPFTWSTCSREYITGFLDSGGGQCLINRPRGVDLRYPDTLAGQMHDAQAQCTFQLGSKSEACKLSEVCRELWCTDHTNTCVTNNIPGAEGTSCSTDEIEKGWCYKGKCVTFGWQPEKVDGAWGEWSRWGQCSRTCGGGVEASIRDCNKPSPDHGGKYCVGQRKRYRSCNVHDCPTGTQDYREMQCAKFNHQKFRNRYYKWKPFNGGGVNPCALNCLAVGYNFYTERAPKVADGTRCFPDSVDLCINGECRHVGCDRILGSDAVEDKCRVCGGDGSQCKVITGTVDDPMRSHHDSYQELVRIPHGAVHIKVEEEVMSRNYLALKSITGKYHINGLWTVDWPRKFEVANTVFHYERPKDGTESLYALGPTSEDLFIMILLQEDNLGISYRYNLPLVNVTFDVYDFGWSYAAWNDCSTSCGKGTTTSTAVCMQRSTMKIVDDSRCLSHLKPTDRVRSCNDVPCPPEWHASNWSTCSQTCGGGEKIRDVLCRQIINEDTFKDLPYKECPQERPRGRVRCNEEKCPPYWTTDEWSECQPLCGPGLQTRSIYCITPEGNYMDPAHCPPRKRPADRQRCMIKPCPDAEWTTGAWEECSSECGKGQQMRTVACRDYRGNESNSCLPEMRPSEIQECEGFCMSLASYECKDVNKVAYCPLVLQFQFCSRPYFRQLCCKTCTEAGQ